MKCDKTSTITCEPGTLTKSDESAAKSGCLSRFTAPSETKDDKKDVDLEATTAVTPSSPCSLNGGRKTKTPPPSLFRAWLTYRGKIAKEFWKRIKDKLRRKSGHGHCCLPQDLNGYAERGLDKSLASFRSVIEALPGNLSLSMFEIGPTVGTGSYATVCIAKWKDGIYPPVALKILHKTKVIEENQVRHLKNEKSILKAIEHPFIVNFITCFQDAVNVYLVLEYCCGGEMFTHVKTRGNLGRDVATFYIAQVALALGYLHSKRIVFRDLKPENILLDVDGYIRLVDFGFAKTVKNKTYTLCGTHEYLAPEVFLRNGHGKEADWWSLGILFYEFLTGDPPFRAADPLDAYELALENVLEFPRHVDATCQDFIRRLLVVNPSRRLGAKGSDAVVKHEIFKAIDFKMLLLKRAKAPILPNVQDECDTSNYYKYPEEWQRHKVPVNVIHQQCYFANF